MKSLLAVLLTITLLGACRCNITGKRVVGNGNLESETRVVNRATKIKVLGHVEVILDSGATSVRVEADENLLKYILTEVDDNWLEIRMKNNINYTTSNPMRVYVTTPTITHIKMAGSGKVVSERKFWSKESINFDIAGSGDIDIDVNTPKVDADIAGSGNLAISGETRNVDVSIAGSGNYNGLELKAENANIKIAGSGDALVFADVKMNAKIMGSGNVKYRGNATIDKKILGSGSIKLVE
ncbi:MAG TPA: head GIN domain-containing protein [Segetibacter sp.]|jgi:hypothetical protein